MAESFTKKMHKEYRTVAKENKRRAKIHFDRWVNAAEKGDKAGMKTHRERGIAAMDSVGRLTKLAKGEKRLGKKFGKMYRKMKKVN